MCAETEIEILLIVDGHWLCDSMVPAISLLLAKKIFPLLPGYYITKISRIRCDKQNYYV